MLLLPNNVHFLGATSEGMYKAGVAVQEIFSVCFCIATPFISYRASSCFIVAFFKIIPESKVSNNFNTH